MNRKKNWSDQHNIAGEILAAPLRFMYLLYFVQGLSSFSDIFYLFSH
jgi:hypothetical protein